MKKTVFWALIALNAALLAGLIAPYFHSNQAMAQRAGGGGRRPDLMLIPGEIIGGNSAVVYLVDTNNRRLGAVSLNQRGTALDSLAPQPLDRVFEERAMDEAGAGGAAGGRNPRGGNAR
jgi:hypothetical protein